MIEVFKILNGFSVVPVDRFFALLVTILERSLKVIEVGAIRKLGCGFLFAFYSNYGRICSRL